MRQTFKIAAIDAILTAIYVAAVATFMTYADKLFGSADNVLGGMAILMLMVLSVAVVGTLILGRPLMMYLDGDKKEAVKALAQTILAFFVLTILVFMVLILI